MGHKPSTKQSDAPEGVAASLTDFAARLAQHGALLGRLLAHGRNWTEVFTASGAVANSRIKTTLLTTWHAAYAGEAFMQMFDNSEQEVSRAPKRAKLAAAAIIPTSIPSSPRYVRGRAQVSVTRNPRLTCCIIALVYMLG